MTNVGLVFGGRSVEHKVSVNSARTVAQGLRDAGHNVVPLGIAADGCWVDRETSESALNGEIDRIKATGGTIAASLHHLLNADAEVLFPIVHGTWGEDGTLQGLAEMLDLPYTGTGVTSSAIAMDKVFCKQVLAASGLAVVEGESCERTAFERNPDAEVERLAFCPPPLFVKPAIGGSSVGVSKVESRKELAEALRNAFLFDDRLLVERGVNGRELECAVLGFRDLAASAIGEIVPGKAFYDYADKYIDDGAQLLMPAELETSIEEEIRELSTRAFAAVGGWGMARVDFLLENGTDRLYINEINTLPGFTAISMYPKLWEIAGIPLPELTDRLVRIALERHAAQKRLDEGIKGWIRDLG